MLEHNNQILFLFIGPMDKVSVYNTKYRHLDNVKHIAKWESQKKVAEFISISDLCLAGHFSGKIGKAKRVIPGKAFIYLAMGKPTILCENDANRELFSDSFYNIHFVSMGNAISLKKKIQELANRDKSRKAEA